MFAGVSLDLTPPHPDGRGPTGNTQVCRRVTGRMSLIIKPAGKARPLRLRGVVRCPYNGFQVGWCRALCTPVEGVGPCGRPAGHALRSRLQEAMAAREELSGRFKR